jgi:hypothetical protein
VQLQAARAEAGLPPLPEADLIALDRSTAVDTELTGSGEDESDEEEEDTPQAQGAHPIPLRYWLFTPELQLQFRGERRILQGCVGQAHRCRARSESASRRKKSSWTRTASLGRSPRGARRNVSRRLPRSPRRGDCRRRPTRRRRRRSR